MKESEYVLLETCCAHYNIHTSFVMQLKEHGLMEVVENNQQAFIAHRQLNVLERYMHLHFDLDINMEGLEAISHLLQRIQNMQHELLQMKNRISRYE